MIQIIAIVVVAIIALLGYAATRPDRFRIARSTVITAPPETIFALIADFHRWTAWSPWEKLDPAMSRSYGGPTSGLGATYGWDGAGKAGAGKMEIIEAASPSNLTIDLAFLKPFKANNTAIFTLAREGDATRVTWVMEGVSPFISKLMGLFLNMDKLVGDDFEKGLANLKTLAEARADD